MVDVKFASANNEYVFFFLFPVQYVNGELKKIPRPLNAFMIFSNEKRKELKKEFPGEPNNMISSR